MKFFYFHSSTTRRCTAKTVWSNQDTWRMRHLHMLEMEIEPQLFTLNFSRQHKQIKRTCECEKNATCLPTFPIWDETRRSKASLDCTTTTTTCSIYIHNTVDQQIMVKMTESPLLLRCRWCHKVFVPCHSLPCPVGIIQEDFKKGKSP